MDDLDKDHNDRVSYAEFRAGMKSQWHLFKPKLDKVHEENKKAHGSN